MCFEEIFIDVIINDMYFCRKYKVFFLSRVFIDTNIPSLDSQFANETICDETTGRDQKENICTRF